MNRQTATSPATTQYLAEVFAPEWSEEDLRDTCERVRLAAESAEGSGGRVRYLHSVLVPRDETAFFLFEAQLAGAVEHVLEVVGLEAERISPAIPAAIGASSA